MTRLTIPSLSAHDFLTPQPVKDADVFVLRAILHDWSDKYCIQILRHLRAAAMPSTRLVIIDRIMSYACTDETLNTISGAELVAPPAPLVANGGSFSAVAYFVDLNMLALQNGKERTVEEFRRLLEQTGWTLVQVIRQSSFAVNSGKLVAVPA